MGRRYPTPMSCLLSIIVIALAAGCRTAEPTRPGPTGAGSTLLPNGWTLTPAGEQVQVGDLPLNMLITLDSRYTIVLNSGDSGHSINMIDNATWNVTSTTPVAKAWVGMALYDEGRRLMVSGANDGCVNIYGVGKGILEPLDSIALDTARDIWVSGLDVDPQTNRAFVTARGNDHLYELDLASRTVVHSITLPAKPYTCLVSRFRPRVYVTLWGGAKVLVLDPETLNVLGSYPTGDHPNEIIESPDGKRLFVSNANANTVTVIDAVAGRVQETLSVALAPGAPYGSTPNSLALSTDGTNLYVANADNNCLAVLDVSRPGNSAALGFIPTGWYPTCVRVRPSTGEIIVANGKGGGSMANPKGPNPEHRRRRGLVQYIGSLFKGTVSKIPVPDGWTLAEMSARVYANSPLTHARGVVREEGNPIPEGPEGNTPIEHVFYIIKENRTYDQVFGDIPEGNGDPSLCLFPESVTPNEHALVRQFVLLDNFYADAEVSADGHNWSMGAYATDYVEKSWPTVYGGKGGKYDFEGGKVAAPSGGYLWDDCQRKKVSYRSYGEFVENGRRHADPVTPSVPALEGHVAPYYRGFDLGYSDIERERAWEKEFDEYERNGDLPRLEVIRLPNDHTRGTRRRSPTPRAYVANNDVALGMIVERISHSRYWKSSAIFVVEDDAQNGPDHVDAHRTTALVISPWTKRGVVDSTMYSTTSMLRTMELILGLSPMSQFDASATPMFASFTLKPDDTPYEHIPARVGLDETNLAGAYGQQRCEEMDFAEADDIPDVELNEIIWKAVRGAASPMPAPVRSAFVRVHDED